MSRCYQVAENFKSRYYFDSIVPEMMAYFIHTVYLIMTKLATPTVCSVYTTQNRWKENDQWAFRCLIKIIQKWLMFILQENALCLEEVKVKKRQLSLELAWKEPISAKWLPKTFEPNYLRFSLTFFFQNIFIKTFF